MAKEKTAPRNPVTAFGLWAKSFAAHWSHPKPENDMSSSEQLALQVANLGGRAYSSIVGFWGFGQGAAIASVIFGLKLQHFYVNGIMSAIFGYAFGFVGPYITDNMGRFTPQNRNRLLMAGGAGLVLAGFLWWLPVTRFDHLMPDFFKHLAVNVFFTVVGNALNAVILRVFGKRWGKFKPFKFLYIVPLLLSATAITFIPYRTMGYNRLFLVTHIMCAAVGLFGAPATGLGDMLRRVSTRPQERVRLFAILPVIGGLIHSVYTMAAPVIFNVIGAGERDLLSYRLVIPVYGAFCSVLMLFILRVKERVMEEQTEKPPELSLREQFRWMFTDKHMWIQNLQNWFSFGGDAFEGVITWLCLYGNRMEWIKGIVINAIKLPTSTPGNILCIPLAKRWPKRRIMIFTQMGQVILTVPILLAFLGTAEASPYLQIALVGIFAGLRNLLGCSQTAIESAMMCDSLDHLQWRSGYRMEASSGLYGYLATPVGMLVGMVSPFVMKQIGVIGDMDVLFDATIRQSFIVTMLLLSMVSTFANGVPYFFYTLSPQKMAQVREELLARAAKAEQEGAAGAEAPEGGELA
ncbi:MAG: hypothetical protein LBC83_07940 [Oscillospiraceae bacterium]|jgi:Na+/melibiose symporter-like transporter|nr:hypothetical protein [Oscillospiraceae bacterium]